MKTEKDARHAVQLFEDLRGVKDTLCQLADELTRNVRFNCIAIFTNNEKFPVHIDLSAIVPSEEAAIADIFKVCLERKLERIVKQLQRLDYET